MIASQTPTGPKKVLRFFYVTVCLVAGVWACADHGPESATGSYELVSINGHLPRIDATFNGYATYGGGIDLRSDFTYTRTEDYSFSNVPRATSIVSGTWSLDADDRGLIRFDGAATPYRLANGRLTVFFAGPQETWVYERR